MQSLRLFLLGDSLNALKDFSNCKLFGIYCSRVVSLNEHIFEFKQFLKLESSTLAWPHQVIEALKSLSQGPSHSRVDSGEVLFLAISDLRNSLSLSPHLLAPSAADGYALFFDEVFFFLSFLIFLCFFFLAEILTDLNLHI